MCRPGAWRLGHRVSKFALGYDIYIYLSMKVNGPESDHNSGRGKESVIDSETELILDDQRRAPALLQVFSRRKNFFERAMSVLGRASFVVSCIRNMKKEINSLPIPAQTYLQQPCIDYLTC